MVIFRTNVTVIRYPLSVIRYPLSRDTVTKKRFAIIFFLPAAPHALKLKTGAHRDKVPLFKCDYLNIKLRLQRLLCCDIACVHLIAGRNAPKVYDRLLLKRYDYNAVALAIRASRSWRLRVYVTIPL